MFKTKLEVDRHVDNSLRKINNETERNLRCFSFAKLYYNVGDYEQACRYISSYLSVKPKSSEGQLLLGRALEKLGKKEAALEAYRTSLQLDSKQNNLVIKVCELLASEEVDMDKTGAKYFCELAQSFDPHNPAVFNLKERLITSENDDPIDISNLLLKELENRPTDVNLRVKLLKHFLQTNMIKEAYKHASDIEEKNLSIFHTNLAWYETFAEVLLRYQRDHSFSNQLNWEFWFHTVSVFDRLVGLSLDEHIDTVKNDTEYVTVVFNFDQMLNKASQNITTCPDRQLAAIFLNHYYGQLYFHLATLLLKQAKKDLIPFKEALNYSLPVMFAAYHCQPPDTHSVWLNHANDQRQRTVNRWYKEACYRCSQLGHILIATAKDRKSVIVEKATQYSTGMWREQLFKRLFVKREQQQKMVSSYFVNNAQNNEPVIKLPELNDLVKYDEIAQLVHPDSLHHYVWVARNCSLPSFGLISFEGLQYTIKNFNNCAAESLNVLDLQAFVYCATLCAQSRLDESKNLIYYNHEKIGVVMAAITEDLSTLNQSKFIKAAYKMYKNEYGSNMGELRLLLIKGIEVVRCVGQHGLDIKLLVHLANIFAERSKVLTKQTEIDANDARAELYWKTALPLLEKLKNNQAVTYAPNRLFEYKGKEMALGDVCGYIEKGRLFIGVQLMKKKEYERALQIFEMLKDPYASFYQSQIYKHMADQKTNQNKENVTSEMRSQNIILLSRARDCLYLTLDRLREPGMDKSHPLNMQMGNEIEKIERLLSRIDPDCSNRNECDGMSDENVSTDSAGEHYLTSYTTHHTSFHNGTPKHDAHNQSTPYRLDFTRREARPSPERLDAQIRQLAASKDIALNTVLDQNKIMIDSHRSLLEELRSFKDAVNNLTATVDDLKTMKSGLDELKEVKKSVIDLKQSVDELQNVVDVVHEMKREISELKKDSSKNNQLSDEDLYVLDPEYDYNINSNMAAAYNPNMYQNYQGRMSNPNSLSYGPAAGLYPGLYPAAMAYAYGGLPLPQTGLQFVPDQQIASLAASSLPQQPATFGQAPLVANLPTTQSLNLGLMPNPVAAFPQNTLTLKEYPKATLSTFTSTTQSVFPAMSPISSNQAQTSAINKAPPVNVVITASDPLPSNKASISQPILSVTIPPQHIKSKPVQQPHNYQIPLPLSTVSSTPSILSKPPPSISTDSLLSNIAPPLFSAIGNTKTPPKNVTLGLQIERSLDENYSPGKGNTSLNKSNTSIEEYDPCPDFKPIIPLPDEVPTNTGEEHETVLFSQTAKLFRYVDSNGVKEWKERGVGNLKILLNPDTKKIRILMRRDQVFKICANHYLTKDLQLTAKNERAYIWAANDFADEKMVLEKFCVRFKTAEEAGKFYNAVEDAKKRLSGEMTPIKTVKSVEVKSTPTQAAATSLGGFVFVTPPTFKPKETQSEVKIKEIEEPAKSSPFANFSFGAASQNSSKFKPITTFNLQSNNPPVKAVEEERVEEFVPTAEFEPVIALPDLVTVETGEENSDVLFEGRAKLFRLCNTGDVKEWKERGIGTIKVLKDDKIIRVIMRRDQVHKVCCNHQVLKDMTFTLNASNPKAVLWHAKDFSEGELVPETFTARFKTHEQAEQFLKTIQSSQNLLDEQNGVSNKHHKGEETSVKQTTNFGDKFKPAKGSWECKNCYIVNEGKSNHCVACETSKSGTGTKRADESAGAVFSFGVNSESKPNVGSWGNAFKPAEGTWECKMCYIRNTADVSKCVSCQANKDGVTSEKPAAKGVNLETPGVKFAFGIPQTVEKAKSSPQLADVPKKFTFGTPESVEKTKSTPQVGFGDMFKPKEGSWSCKVCYVLNASDKLYCLSCDNPKDETVAKKEAASKGVDLSTNAKFSFGIPATTTASASVADTTTTQKPFSFNDASKLGGGQFLFGASKSTTSVVTTPATSTSATFAFASTNAKKAEGTKFVFGSPQKHEFEFTPRSPRRVSSGQNDDESDGSYVEEENDNIYFKPVIPLPEKVDVKTGEEQEDVLYCHRAKLFRFVNGEWKERGIGDVKILRRKETGKLRVVMRREQVFKICLNHMLSKEIEYLAKDEKTWLFHAADYSDGEISHEQFCIRFKDGNIAQEFKKAVNDALNCGSSDKSGETKETSSTENAEDTVEFVSETKVSSEEEKEALRLGLPPKFLSYKQLPDCECEQCKEDDVYLKELFDKKPTQVAAISSSFNKTVFGTPISSVSSGSSVFGTPNSSFSFTPCTVGAAATPPSTGETLKDLLRKPKITPAATGSVFGGNSAVVSESKPSTPNFSFTLNSTPTPTTTNTAPSIFGGGATKVGSVFNATLFNTTTSSTTFGSNAGTPVATTTTAPSLFGNFTPTTNSSNIFGNSNNLFTSGGSIFSNTPSTPFGSSATSVFGGSGGFTSAGSLFNKENAVKSDTEKLKEDDEVILKCDTGLSFASLAAKTAEPAFVKTSEEKPFSFSGAGQPVFGAKFKPDTKNSPNKSRTESDGEEGGAEEYDPHYDPIVPLPEAIIVSTGEEGETAMFNERAKVYRFDDGTKEWKERGVGQMKILFHPVNLTYRLLLRREQVHKVVLNQLITSDLDVQPMSTSDKAWMWAGHNYSDDELKLEKLAVRFKSVEMAKQFNDVIQGVICKVIEITNRKAVPESVRNFGVEDVSDEQVTIEEINDEDEEEEDDEEEDEKSVMITKPCSLYEQNENEDSWTHVANGEVQIYYDSDCYVAKIWVADEENAVVSNTLIGSNTLMDVDKNVCVWKAVESIDENNIRWRNLKAEFKDEESAQMFHSTYLEGVNYAQELGITDEIVTDEGETEEN